MTPEKQFAVRMVIHQICLFIIIGSLGATVIMLALKDRNKK